MSLILEACSRILAERGVGGREGAMRMAVCAEALTWLGTPYHVAGRVKGAGVDCAMFPLCVFSTVGVVEDYDPGYYAPDWHLHRSEEKYLAYMEQHAARVDREPLPGDIALFRYGRTVSHSAIVLNAPLVIHSWNGQGVILDELTGGNLNDRPDRFSGLWQAYGLRIG